MQDNMFTFQMYLSPAEIDAILSAFNRKELVLTKEQFAYLTNKQKQAREAKNV